MPVLFAEVLPVHSPGIPQIPLAICSAPFSPFTAIISLSKIKHHLGQEEFLKQGRRTGFAPRTAVGGL